MKKKPQKTTYGTNGSLQLLKLLVDLPLQLVESGNALKLAQLSPTQVNYLMRFLETLSVGNPNLLCQTSLIKRCMSCGNPFHGCSGINKAMTAIWQVGHRSERKSLQSYLSELQINNISRSETSITGIRVVLYLQNFNGATYGEVCYPTPQAKTPLMKPGLKGQQKKEILTKRKLKKNSTLFSDAPHNKQAIAIDTSIFPGFK